ncbi:MAG: nitroreductase/quinone reductase family protein [Mycobacterium sp.]
MATLFGQVAKVFNAPVTWLASAPVIGPLVGKQIVMITYIGRKSGRTVTTPVAYRRAGDEVVIPVGLPDAKSWWRNFTGEGAPITLKFDAGDRHGRGVTTRDDRGRVSVRVALDPVG